jgi:hypothetical protein
MQRRYDDEAGVDKVSQVDLCWKPAGSIGTKARVEEKQPLMVFNSGPMVAYIKFSIRDSDAAPPSGPENGIPVLSGEKLRISAGKNLWVVASTSAVYLYTATD